MLLQVEATRAAEDTSADRFATEAEGHFLNTLVAWGTTSVLKEYIKLYQSHSAQNSRVAATLRTLDECFVRRCEQSSANYLQLPAEPNPPTDESVGARADVRGVTDDKVDSLYDINKMLEVVRKRVPVFFGENPATRYDGRAELDALARLNMMKGNYDDALRCFLMIGILHPIKTFEELEVEAVFRTQQNTKGNGLNQTLHEGSYALVLSIVSNHHQHGCLLDGEFLPETNNSPPLFALLRLVGLDLLEDFLIDHCVAPQPSHSLKKLPAKARSSAKYRDKVSAERRGTLPLDLVASQLESSPSVLLWYLHLVFTRKPEVYVKFPNTANPPDVITRLHRKQIELYIKYAGNFRNSRFALAGTEAYRAAEKSTPLLSFLKVGGQA